ncbi:MAG TPA: type II secretion system F family protein [Gemmatimonadales bacterium]|jgi:type II secretory pathway component PulF|nr:type II secretion system F family protein [Gemmatimonadales bacterium]
MSARFRYRAATLAGQVVEGAVYAPSRQSVLEALHRQQLYPVTVEDATTAGPRRATRQLGRRAAVMLWTRNTAALLGAGVPLDRALAFAAQHTAHAGLADAVRQVRRLVQGGASLADAIAQHPRYFDALFVAMISAGETSGALDIVFERLSEHLEEGAELRSLVGSALLYPAVLSVVATIGVIVLLGFVIPRFAAILADVGGRLPLSTRLLLGASALLTKGWPLWLLLTAATTYAIPKALARPDTKRRWHAARLRWPWIGDIELKYATARLARTFGLLLKSGVPAVPALRIARAAATNLVVRDGVDRASAALAEGTALAPALAGTLPPLALQMIAVGEESGRLEELCLRVADTYDGEVRRALRTAVTLLEPALILIFGALVGFVALAMLQAIYGVNLKAF